MPRVSNALLCALAFIAAVLILSMFSFWWGLALLVTIAVGLGIASTQ